MNGIPVLARIAANDMQLMSEAEVSNALNMDIHTKAERKHPIVLHSSLEITSNHETPQFFLETKF